MERPAGSRLLGLSQPLFLLCSEPFLNPSHAGPLSSLDLLFHSNPFIIRLLQPHRIIPAPLPVSARDRVRESGGKIQVFPRTPRPSQSRRRQHHHLGLYPAEEPMEFLLGVIVEELVCQLLILRDEVEPKDRVRVLLTGTVRCAAAQHHLRGPPASMQVVLRP